MRLFEAEDRGAQDEVQPVAEGSQGLRAVRQRLETRYPNEASFRVTTAPREGFVVRAMIPAHVATVLPAATDAIAAPAAP